MTFRKTPRHAEKNKLNFAKVRYAGYFKSTITYNEARKMFNL